MSLAAIALGSLMAVVLAAQAMIAQLLAPAVRAAAEPRLAAQWRQTGR